MVTLGTLAKRRRRFVTMKFIVEEGTPDTTDIVAACSHHLLGWAIVRTVHGLAKEIKLTSSNHVANSWDVIKHPSHVFIVEMLFLDSKH